MYVVILNLRYFSILFMRLEKKKIVMKKRGLANLVKIISYLSLTDNNSNLLLTHFEDF